MVANVMKVLLEKIVLYVLVQMIVMEMEYVIFHQENVNVIQDLLVIHVTTNNALIIVQIGGSV
jgi:hypothetical protein